MAPIYQTFLKDLASMIDIQIDDILNANGVRPRQSTRNDSACRSTGDYVESVLRFKVTQQSLDDHRGNDASNAPSIDG
jgi:hypothetical protein